VVLLIVIQALQPARTNPPIASNHEMQTNLTVNRAVSEVLSRSCNDCHSNRTAWPWYSHVAPASWLVVSDVNRGRKALNFSEWTTYATETQKKHLSEVCKEITEGEMPGFPYTLMHSAATLRKTDIAAVCQWTEGTSQRLSAAKEE
jgi:hypothetical protein